MSTSPPHRYEVLDGVRGLAALMVVLYHVGMNAKVPLMAGAWAAVDLFFVLSGFVIAFSYGDKILAGLSLRRYATLRLVRLMPMYLLGTVIGWLAWAPDVLHGEPAMPSVGGWVKLGLSQLAMVPYLGHAEWLGPHTRVADDTLFPLNPPAWSLFFELIVNFGFFLWLWWWRSVPAWLVAIALGAYAWLCLRSGVMHGGWSTGNVAFGLPRVAAEFGLGVLLFRWRPTPSPRLLLPAAVAVALVMVGFTSHTPQWSLATALLVCPVAIWLCAGVQAGPLLGRVCHHLGELSYPLYIVHLPLYTLGKHWFGLQQAPLAVQLAAVAGAGGLFCWWLAKPDLALRRALLKRLS